MTVICCRHIRLNPYKLTMPSKCITASSHHVIGEMIMTTKMGNGFVIGLALTLSLWSFNWSNAMVGGTVHPLGLSKFPATIKIRKNCTGAKIGPRTFLTAGHCIIDRETGTFKDMFKAGGKI